MRRVGTTVVARLLGVHKVTVRDWARRGLIPGWRTAGGHLRFDLQEITAWKRKHLAELATGGGN